MSAPLQYCVVEALQFCCDSQAETSKLPLSPKPPPPMEIPPFRSTPKWPYESTQPSAFSVARPKKFAWPVKPKNHWPAPITSFTYVYDPGVPYVTVWFPPTTTSTDVVRLITSSRVTVPSMCSLNEWAVMVMPLATWSSPVVFSRICPLPLITTMSKTLKLIPTSSWSTRPQCWQLFVGS